MSELSELLSNVSATTLVLWILIAVLGALAAFQLWRFNKARRSYEHQLRELAREKQRSLKPETVTGEEVAWTQRDVPPTAYLWQVGLRNVRCFEDLEVTFHQGESPLLRAALFGDNAAGKSTLLRCLAIALCDESDAVALMKQTPGSLIRRGAASAQIDVVLKVEGSGRTLRITKRIERDISGSERLRQTTEPGEDFPWNSVFVCGYGTQRTAAASASFESYSPRLAVETLFDVRAALQNPEVVLLRQPTELRRRLERKVLDVLLLDENSGSIENTREGMKIRGPWGPAAFNELSDGYRSTTQWLLDLFAWLVHAGRYGPEEEPGGIVLIDEIEQHLHPRWQRHVIQRLRDQLPRCQMIVTTHTPLVASGLADVSEAVLLRMGRGEEGKHFCEAIDPERLSGKRADQVLTELFGLVTSRNPGSSEELNRYVQLKAKRERSEQEEKELQELAQRFDSALRFGETPLETTVLEAVDNALDALLQRPADQAVSVEAKRQLRELFGPREGVD